MYWVANISGGDSCRLLFKHVNSTSTGSSPTPSAPALPSAATCPKCAQVSWVVYKRGSRNVEGWNTLSAGKFNEWTRFGLRYSLRGSSSIIEQWIFSPTHSRRESGYQVHKTGTIRGGDSENKIGEEKEGEEGQEIGRKKSMTALGFLSQ